ADCLPGQRGTGRLTRSHCTSRRSWQSARPNNRWHRRTCCRPSIGSPAPTHGRLKPVRIRFAVCLGILAVVLSSCGGSSDNAEELAKRLDHAKTQLDEATTVSIKLKADDLPGDATGLLTAEGKGNHDPAFTGDVTVQT